MSLWSFRQQTIKLRRQRKSYTREEELDTSKCAPIYMYVHVHGYKIDHTLSLRGVVIKNVRSLSHLLLGAHRYYVQFAVRRWFHSSGDSSACT